MSKAYRLNYGLISIFVLLTCGVVIKYKFMAKNKTTEHPDIEVDIDNQKLDSAKTKQPEHIYLNIDN